METFKVEFDRSGKWWWKDQTHHMKVGEKFTYEMTVPEHAKGKFDFASAPPGAQCWRHNQLTYDGAPENKPFNKRGAAPGASSIKLEPGITYKGTMDFDNGTGGLYEDPNADGTSVISFSIERDD